MTEKRGGGVGLTATEVERERECERHRETETSRDKQIQRIRSDRWTEMGMHSQKGKETETGWERKGECV